MKDYQTQYIANLTRAAQLGEIRAELSPDAEHFWEERQKNRAAIVRLVKENTSLLRANLFPVLDNIASASREEIKDLEEFALALIPGGRQLDVMLSYTIHNTLIAYARQWELRDLLIRELYHTAMAVYYLHTMIQDIAPERYRWKMQLLFGEAASYIKLYDEIEDPETRGYIHRSMANLALGYSSSPPATGKRKMETIRRSLQILTDPVFQAKTPSLPWDLYIYKSHQERTTSLSFLRSGGADAQTTREVMESAEYVRDRQKRDSERTGQPPSLRWSVVYESSQYHCGILTLEAFLKRLEEFYLSRDPSDYSPDGSYANLFLPAIYSQYVSQNRQYLQAKKEMISHMYRMMLRYVRNAPAQQMSVSLMRSIMDTFASFIEYPGGLQQKDLLLQMVVCRNPETFVYLQMTACVSRMLLERTIQEMPQLLLGVLGYDTVEEITAARQELADLAYGCGMFHDIGQLNFAKMTTMAGRIWFKEEQEIFRLHTKVGAAILARCESTQLYADAAAGHHCYFSGDGGYPDGYDRTEHPNQPIVDIVSIAASFNRLLDNNIDYTKEPLSLPQALEHIRLKAGSRFSPDLVRLLLEMEPELEEYLRDGRMQAYRLAFQYLKNEDPLP